MSKIKQYKLLDVDNSVWEIKKHSSLVQISSHANLLQRKAMNALICVAKDALKRNPEQRIFECDISLVKRLSGLASNDNEDLKEGMRTLKNMNIEFNLMNKDKSKQRGVFSFLSYASIHEQGRGKPTCLKFEFPSIILEVVKNPRMYVTLNLLVIRGLNSKYSIALYEFLKDYIKLGTIACTLIDFRQLMGIKEGQYAYSTMLRKRVLEVAVKEINEKTDVQVSYELEKKGRQLLAIHFSMSLQADQKLGANKNELESKLKSFGLKDKKIQYLLEHHDEQYIWANIGVVEEQAKKGKIENITAYLLKAFQNDYRPLETEHSKLTAQKQAKEKAQKLKIEQKEIEKKQLAQAFKAWKKETALQRFSALEEQEKQNLKAVYLEDVEDKPFLAKALEKKGFEHPLIQGGWQTHLAERFLSKEEKDIAWFSEQQP